jgi:DNA-binding NarL/FixJ family response regulator
VVVGDDQPLFREGVIHVLSASGFDVVAAVGNADDLVRKVRAHLPDIALVDIRMPPNLDVDGLRAAHLIREIRPTIAVLVLSQFLEDAYVIDLLGDRPEGVGYLLKDRVADVERFSGAVGRVAQGESVIDAEVVERLVGRRRGNDAIDELTAQEREVLGLMAQGMSNRRIAEALLVAVLAVEIHVTSIFAKLGLAHDRQEHRRVLALLRYLHR